MSKTRGMSGEEKRQLTDIICSAVTKALRKHYRTDDRYSFMLDSLWPNMSTTIDQDDPR